MNLTAIETLLKNIWQLVEAAPFPFLALVVFVTIVVWGVLRFVYRERFNGLGKFPQHPGLGRTHDLSPQLSLLSWT